MKKLITLVLVLACILIFAGCTKTPHIPTDYDVDGVKMVYTHDGGVTSEAIDIYDEEIVSELFAMHNGIEAKATNRSMSDEVMGFIFGKVK